MILTQRAIVRIRRGQVRVHVPLTLAVFRLRVILLSIVAAVAEEAVAEEAVAAEAVAIIRVIIAPAVYGLTTRHWGYPAD